MTRGVALPPVRKAAFPLVVAEVCVHRGPVAALEWIERAAVEVDRQADRWEAAGGHKAAEFHRRVAAGMRRDALFFAAVHA